MILRKNPIYDLNVSNAPPAIQVENSASNLPKRTEAKIPTKFRSAHITNTPESSSFPGNAPNHITVTQNRRITTSS